MGAHVAVYGLGYFFLLFLDGDVGPTGGTRAGKRLEGNTVGSLSRGRAAAARPREASSFLLFFFFPGGFGGVGVWMMMKGEGLIAKSGSGLMSG